MKKNRNILIVLAVLVLVAAGLWLTRRSDTFRGEASDFTLNDSSTVTRIFMSDKNNNTVTLERMSNGKWSVNGKYDAQSLTIDMLLRTMVSIEVRQPVAKAAHDNIIKELAVNSVKVEIYQRVFRIDIFGAKLFPHEKLTKVYYVGGATQNNQGCFMLMQGSEEPFVVYMPGFRGFVSPRYSPMEKDWRDYNIFRKNIPEIGSVKVEMPETPEFSYEVRNNGKNKFTLTALKDGRTVPDYDTLKVLNFLSGFRNLNFEALLNDMAPAQKDSILASKPFIILTLTDTARTSKTIRIFHKKGGPGMPDPEGLTLPYDPDRLYASVNDGRDFTLIQYYTFDKVLRPLPFFSKEGTRP